MNAGNLVYDHPSLADMSRRELEEFLCDAIEAVCGPETTNRLSNGQIADTLFRCLDLLIITDEHRERLAGFLAGR